MRVGENNIGKGCLATSIVDALLELQKRVTRHAISLVDLIAIIPQGSTRISVMWSHISSSCQ
jgi:hypothetical protein